MDPSEDPMSSPIEDMSFDHGGDVRYRKGAPLVEQKLDDFEHNEVELPMPVA